ncbi:hypothetical protein PYW07_006284 [Mythimna separata]|uniref:DUF4817 domain-containing protein n=1 Tax=Mythimna separata TaxID=271217 RepID=A0AAD7YV07_MYTSE|nr:hypothetical protein PYW07_006284 [Mythimna separata]
MVRMLARCNDNVNLAVRRFREEFGVSVSNRTILAATQRLRDHGAFMPRKAHPHQCPSQILLLHLIVLTVLCQALQVVELYKEKGREYPPALLHHVVNTVRQRRPHQTPFDRATSEFVAIEESRLRLERERETRQHNLEMGRLIIEAQRVQVEAERVRVDEARMRIETDIRASNHQLSSRITALIALLQTRDLRPNRTKGGQYRHHVRQRRLRQTPFDRATSEFVAIEESRLQLERKTDKRRHSLEMERLKIEAQRKGRQYPPALLHHVVNTVRQRRLHQTPFDRATSEFVAIEESRLQLERERETRQHNLEMGRLIIEAQRKGREYPPALLHHVVNTVRQRRLHQTPFDRATSEFVAIEESRLRLERKTKKRQNSLEMERLKIEAQRVQVEAERVRVEEARMRIEADLRASNHQLSSQITALIALLETREKIKKQ